jgi:hypothetical protein
MTSRWRFAFTFLKKLLIGSCPQSSSFLLSFVTQIPKNPKEESRETTSISDSFAVEFKSIEIGMYRCLLLE